MDKNNNNTENNDTNADDNDNDTSKDFFYNSMNLSFPLKTIRGFGWRRLVFLSSLVEAALLIAIQEESLFQL